MTGKLISEKFNLANRAKLWELRTYHGAALTYGHCDALGRIRNVTGEHADRLIAAGQNVYVDIPFDTDDPNAPEVRRPALSKLAADREVGETEPRTEV